MGGSNAEIDFESAPPRHATPIFRKVDGISVIDLIGNPEIPRSKSQRKLLFILLMMTVKDRATELQFEPGHAEGDERIIGILRSSFGIHEEAFVQIHYRIDGELLELYPAPGRLWPAVTREFEAMIGLDSFRHRLATLIRRLASRIDGQPRPCREGQFRLRVDEEMIDVKLVAWPSALGDWIFLTFDPISADLANRVRAEMERLDMLVEAETETDQASPTQPPASPAAPDSE